MNFMNFSGLGGERGANPGEINASAVGAGRVGSFAEQQAKQQEEWAQAMGDQVMASARTASGRDFSLSADATANAADMWARYKGVFQPVENQVVQDAAGYDSPEQLARVRQDAAGNANVAFDTGQASRAVELERMGVNPNSGRFADPNALALSRTTGVADSMNRAVADRQDRAIALRQGVAGFGMNVASAGDRAREIALAATGAGTGVMNAAGGVASTMRTAPSAWANSATSAFTGGAGALNAQQNATTAATDAQNKARLGLGDMLGKMFSSKKAKDRVARVSEGEVVKKIKSMPVDRWSYKKEMLADEAEDGGQREHIGPYAEDFQKRFGVGDGKTINVIDAFGVGFAAIKGLAKKVEALEGARR